MNDLNAIGVMSGSSMDGLDLCAVNFDLVNNQWQYDILAAETVSFPEKLMSQLNSVRTLSGQELSQIDIELGIWIGDALNEFIKANHLTIDIIGSHGHTVFHQVDRKLSLQIGCPQAISQRTQLKVVSHFRQQNVLYGGQGAPLVPIGDLLLFSDYQVCINLGGIANLTIKERDSCIAGDIVPCNQVLNALANRLGLPFDRGGELARTGKLDHKWLKMLQDDEFYKKPLPRSISNEWVYDQYLSQLPEINTEEALHTFSHFIVEEISKYIPVDGYCKVLVTGGGAHNDFLIENIRSLRPLASFEVPSIDLINQKEALIFAFMAVLKINHLPNCLSSYTGASKDLSTGVVYEP